MDNFDFAELKNDKNFIEKITKFSESLDKIDENINNCIEKCKGQTELPINDKIKTDLYMTYSVNSLYWILLKISGKDPNNHGIKNELSRIRESMTREKQLDDKKLRPTLNKGVANRFIKGNISTNQVKKNKIKKFVENLSDSE